MAEQDQARWLEDFSMADTAVVGGKNASLGEMIRNLSPRGVLIPSGFATTAQAYWYFLAANNLAPGCLSNRRPAPRR
ncbi:PEP/pyruvate-binding domain-containing protein [Streptomyces chiangmaiensis]